VGGGISSYIYGCPDKNRSIAGGGTFYGFGEAAGFSISDSKDLSCCLSLSLTGFTEIVSVVTTTIDPSN